MNIGKITLEWAQARQVQIVRFKQIDSTNNVARAEAFKIADPLKIYISDHQTGGRGRYERTWIDSDKKDSLLSSWSYEINESPSPLITAKLGLDVVEAFEKSFPGLHWSLKAPNDILLSGKKIAGILTETISQGQKLRLIIGIGVNVLSSPKEVPESSCLKNGSPDLKDSDWFGFLDQLKIQLDQVIKSCHLPELKTDERSRLENYLNKNPNLKESYSSVGKDGSLFYGDRVISWMEL